VLRCASCQPVHRVKAERKADKGVELPAARDQRRYRAVARDMPGQRQCHVLLKGLAVRSQRKVAGNKQRITGDPDRLTAPVCQTDRHQPHPRSAGRLRGKHQIHSFSAAHDPQPRFALAQGGGEGAGEKIIMPARARRAPPAIETDQDIARHQTGACRRAVLRHDPHAGAMAGAQMAGRAVTP